MRNKKQTKSQTIMGDEYDQNSKEFNVHSAKELEVVADYIFTQNYSKIICFRGELGAGKTTLISRLCKKLNCQDETSSPTFSIVNEYIYSNGIVYHFDLYRLESIEEVFDIGLQEYLDSDEYCFFEWPELIMDIVLDQFVDVLITVGSNNDRKIIISEIH
ncbi:MAG: tRNA (adenosine(37)-N6)-threonylcarbamoyltransferase complex ATPase subunit type 1 TsaE [Saprospiraceae bacterium]